MIIVEAEGGQKAQRELCEDSVRYFISRLLPKFRNLEVNIQLIRGLKESEGIYGDCIWEDRNHNPREFTIRVDSAESEDFILDTLAHEMIHVKQYARGELVDMVREPHTCKWMGEILDWTKIKAGDEPWEIEPWSESKQLFEEYKSYK